MNFFRHVTEPSSEVRLLVNRKVSSTQCSWWIGSNLCSLMLRHAPPQFPCSLPSSFRVQVFNNAWSTCGATTLGNRPGEPHCGHPHVPPPSGFYVSLLSYARLLITLPASTCNATSTSGSFMPQSARHSPTHHHADHDRPFRSVQTPPNDAETGLFLAGAHPSSPGHVARTVPSRGSTDGLFSTLDSSFSEWLSCSQSVCRPGNPLLQVGHDVENSGSWDRDIAENPATGRVVSIPRDARPRRT